MVITKQKTLNKKMDKTTRIISGVLRGKKLAIPSADITRPSSDRTKEAVFSAIESVLMEEDKKWHNVMFLDCFSGSGAMAAEALSRGAYYVISAEKSPEAQKVIRRNFSYFPSEYQQKFTLYEDVFSLPAAKKPADIIFMDAPYGQGLTEKALTFLLKKGWIGENSLIIAEVENKEILPIPEGFSITKEKTYGRAKVCFLQYISKQS